MAKINIAIVGVGNCASSLIQGLGYYRDKSNYSAGLTYPRICGYMAQDIEVVAAFDVDKRKVGKDITKAVFEKPNCSKIFYKNIQSVAAKTCRVKMGRVLDGVSFHMGKYPVEDTFQLSDMKPCDVVAVLKESKAQMLLNYLPVGSRKATEYYARCCLKAGVAFINNIPVFIASDHVWRKRFEDKKLPLIGDDVKSQIGATVLHRTLVRLFNERGIDICGTYQLNIGGNTDFMNMLEPARLVDKKISKTESVQSELSVRLDDSKILIEPSGYVPWLSDGKDCFITIKGKGFAGMPVNLDVKLSVQDSPNSAGVVIDVIRCCKVALDRNIGGALTSISSYSMKHPPVQCSDSNAKLQLNDFIAGKAPK